MGIVLDTGVAEPTVDAELYNVMLVIERGRLVEWNIDFCVAWGARDSRTCEHQHERRQSTTEDAERTDRVHRRLEYLRHPRSLPPSMGL